jgi:rod shape-determining protein MreB
MFGFFEDVLYIRIHREFLTVRDVKTGAQVKEPPLMALSGGDRKEIAAVGYEAQKLKGQPEILLVNPFDHPRTPLSDFTVAEQLIKAFVRKVQGRRIWKPQPTVVIHLAMDLQGGITQIEARALHELALGGAGASKVSGWMGPDLSDEQVRTGKFPASGKAFS